MRESAPPSSGCAMVPFWPKTAWRQRPHERVARTACLTGARQSGVGGGGGEARSPGGSLPHPLQLLNLGLGFGISFDLPIRFEIEFLSPFLLPMTRSTT
jgi:hypothetical protein